MAQKAWTRMQHLANTALYANQLRREGKEEEAKEVEYWVFGSSGQTYKRLRWEELALKAAQRVEMLHAEAHQLDLATPGKIDEDLATLEDAA